jgi:hypothetical protein
VFQADTVNHKADIQALRDQISELQRDMVDMATQNESEKEQLVAKISQVTNTSANSSQTNCL